jgi:hypothetical protein
MMLSVNNMTTLVVLVADFLAKVVLVGSILVVLAQTIWVVSNSTLAISLAISLMVGEGVLALALSVGVISR